MKRILLIASSLLIYTNMYSQASEQIIYFDLDAGSVTINASTYTGYVYLNGDPQKVTGSHSSTTKYYVYQSSSNTESPGYKTETGYTSQEDFNAKQNIRIPDYSAMQVGAKPWGEYITNNTDTEGVASQWVTSAGAALRTGTANTIKISGTNTTFDITIDNLWCTYNSDGVTDKSGIFIGASSHATATVMLRMKNDSRFTNIFYHRNKGKNGSLTFTSADGDNSTNGTLTVIQTSDDWVENNKEYAVIGGYYSTSDSDTYADSYGMYVYGGTMYVGKSPIMGSNWDSSVANDQDGCFGGGATGDGEITINGGTVTAVNHTTSAAIGGGAALTMPGGNGYVTINGGTVYAYSFGIYAQSKSGVIACTAIGSGSTGGSSDSPGTGAGDGTVTINGGYVFAKSIGGTAIGGGNSTYARGGDGTIIITGGTVDAISVGGTVAGHEISASNSIGGGTGGRTANSKVTGGDARVTISGTPVIRAGSVGGGKTNNTKAKIGAACVDITGDPDISAQFLLVKGAAITPYFNMSGGTIHDSKTNDAVYEKVEKTRGGAVYLEDGNCTITGGTISGCEATDMGGAICLQSGNVKISGGTISDCKANNGGAVYLSGGKLTVEGATSIVGNTAWQNGGAAYVNGGSTYFTTTTAYIESNDAVLGGGLYVNGGDIHFKGNLVGNTAVNGGGLYLGPGASMDFQGGLIIENEANMPDGATSAGTAYHGGNNIMGCGGGIYLQNGTSSNKTTLTFNLDPDDKTFGLYTNRANMAGDDLVAEGQYTEVVLPSVREMQLYGFEGKDATPFWYQDYFEGDPGYRDNPGDGRAVENDVNYIGRFREMLNLFTNEYYNHRVLDDNANLTRIQNNYLCLTLSYNMLDITISAKYLLGHETALFRLVRHGGTEDYKYDVLLRGDKTDSTTGKSSRTLRNMPWGTYSIFPNDAWNWAYDKIAPQQNLRLGETGNYEFVFDMNHINGAEVPQHDERQPVKQSGNQ